MIFRNKYISSTILWLIFTMGYYVIKSPHIDAQFLLIALLAVSYPALELYWLERTKRTTVLNILLVSPFYLVSLILLGILPEKSIGGALFYGVFSVLMSKEIISEFSKPITKVVIAGFMIFFIYSMSPLAEWAMQNLIAFFSGGVLLSVLLRKVTKSYYLKEYEN